MPIPDPQRSRVVLVGASTFADPALADLPAVRNNLTDLAACFQDPDLWGLPASHCVVVPDPELPDDFLDPVHTAAEAAEDTLLVYYAGHGQLDHASNELLLAVGRSKSGRSHTSVRYEYVQRDVRNARARRRVVILDCCYAGKAMADAMADPTTAVADEASAIGTYLIASAPPNKQALSPPGEIHTAFTGELITLLRNGIPDGEEYLDLDSIYRHVFYALRDKSRPEPQKRSGNTAGDVALARNVRWRSPDAQTDWEEVKAARKQAAHLYHHGTLRGRVMEQARKARSSDQFRCPVCGITVTGENMLSHFDKHPPEETVEVDPATITFHRWPSSMKRRYTFREVIGGTEKFPTRLAVDAWTDEFVVVKATNTRDEFLIRTLRTVADFDHPRIARIVDIGEEAGRLHTIVTEYVKGQSLAEVLKTRRPMQPRRAAEIVSQVCDALDYAHQQHVVHGGLNARNVMLTEDGTVKVLNFGMKSALPMGAAFHADAHNAGQLLFDLLKGDPEPEALAELRFEMDAPAELRKVVETAQNSNLKQRYRSAGHMRDALDAYLADRA